MSSEMFNPVDSKVDFPAQEQATWPGGRRTASSRST